MKIRMNSKTRLLTCLVALLLALPSLALAQEPQRIVVLPVWGAEMLLEMVGPQRIVGLSAWCDNPTTTKAAEQAAQVEGRVASKDPEGILMLAPDLVILDTFSDFDGSLTKTLTDAGLNVVCLDSPVTYVDIAATLRKLGELTDSTEKAEAMALEVEYAVDQLAQAVLQVPQDQRVKAMYYEDYYDASGSSAGMLCAYGPGSTFDAIVSAAGLINVCDAPNYSAVSKEKVVAEWRPDLLVVPSFHYDTAFNMVEDSGASAREGILGDAILKTLPAVEQGNVISLTECYRGSTSQYMVEAAKELAKAAYPHLFKE